MTSNQTRFLFSALAATCLTTAASHATLIGFNNDPGNGFWDRGDAGSGFGIWDTFGTWQFSAATPASTFGITGPALSQTQAFGTGAMGGGLYDKFTSVGASGRDGASNPGINGDVLFGGGNNVTFVLEGSVSFTIRGVVLQMKRPGSSGTLADASGFLPTLSINGGPAIPFDATMLSTGSGDTVSDAGTYAVTSYIWNTSLAGLVEGANNSFVITANKSGLQRGIDGIQVDVANAVPEPASATVLAGCLGLLGMVRRRRVA